MKSITDKDVLSYWFESGEEFVVEFDSDQVNVHVEDHQVVFTVKPS